jgi:hypothetical protein
LKIGLPLPFPTPEAEFPDPGLPTPEAEFPDPGLPRLFNVSETELPDPGLAVLPVPEWAIPDVVKRRKERRRGKVREADYRRGKRRSGEIDQQGICIILD